ncbi:MAG TPA: hypothetical protein VK811_00295, partial [Candidatus Acidoferrum sp.]|nr:hypothetical protein [Candidatus Acidoferrum sp.]
MWLDVGKPCNNKITGAFGLPASRWKISTPFTFVLWYVMRFFLVFIDSKSKREAIAAQAEEAGVLIARGFGRGDELVPRVVASMLAAIGVVLVLHRD